jgi:VIT1/CCC1 family predicted Fe2+/Mn2+ transporter
VPGLGGRFPLAASCALVALFAVGAGRSVVTASRWWVSGLEMLALGTVVAAVAHGTGATIAVFVADGFD